MVQSFIIKLIVYSRIYVRKITLNAIVLKYKTIINTLNLPTTIPR